MEVIPLQEVGVSGTLAACWSLTGYPGQDYIAVQARWEVTMTFMSFRHSGKSLEVLESDGGKL